MMVPAPMAHSDGNPAPPGPHPVRMVGIPGGTSPMGSNDFYPEERLDRRVTVAGFWMDEHPVTSAEFLRLPRATGSITVADSSPDPRNYPQAGPALPVHDSRIFCQPPDTGRLLRRGTCGVPGVAPSGMRMAALTRYRESN